MTSGEHASGLPGDWTLSMQVLIRESLREFMAQNHLAEFLAGVGTSESETSEFRADTILTKALQVSGEMVDTGSGRPAPSARLRPRTELSAKFRKYESVFSTRAQEMGLELHWIGVGTWKMPDPSSEAAVSGKHVEAWRLNRENAQRSEAQALEQVTVEALLERKLQLVREVPIGRHARNQAKYSDKSVLMECLLQDFLEQMGDALDLRYRDGQPTEELAQLEAAVLKVERLLKISQLGPAGSEGAVSRVRPRSEWLGGHDAPPAPASRSEALGYQALLSKLDGNYRVAEAMIENERRRHEELSREQLISRIVERFERHGH
jgi:hypothetical protein